MSVKSILKATAAAALLGRAVSAPVVQVDTVWATFTDNVYQTAVADVWETVAGPSEQTQAVAAPSTSQSQDSVFSTTIRGPSETQLQPSVQSFAPLQTMPSSVIVTTTIAIPSPGVVSSTVQQVETLYPTTSSPSTPIPAPSTSSPSTQPSSAATQPPPPSPTPPSPPATSSIQTSQPAPASSSPAPSLPPEPNATPLNSIAAININTLVYSPYNNDDSCKSADQVQSDLNLIKSVGVNALRVYATDCNTDNTVLPVAQQLGMKVAQGFYFDSSGVSSIDGQVQSLLSWTATNGWDLFNRIIVGNEAVLNGWVTPADLVNKVGSVKAQLRAAGYNGPVLTAEPAVSYSDNPELCQNDVMDEIGINSHPFFSPTFSPETAGQFVATDIQNTYNLCNHLPVVVTETGYPSNGSPNGNNIPTPENQRTAVTNIANAIDGQGVFLTTFNDFWEPPGPFGVQQYFGLVQLL